MLSLVALLCTWSVPCQRCRMGIVRTDSRTISPHMAVSADDAAKLPKPPSAGFGKDQKLKAEQAKAKRVNANFGQGGVRKSRQSAKRSEQKAAASGRGFGTKSSGGLNYDRRPKPTASCGCGSGRSYGECCSLVHERGGATSTEELVRARFTAFSYRLPDFLMATTDPEGAEWNEDAAAWKKSLLTFCDVRGGARIDPALAPYITTHALEDRLRRILPSRRWRSWMSIRWLTTQRMAGWPSAPTLCRRARSTSWHSASTVPSDAR